MSQGSEEKKRFVLPVFKVSLKTGVFFICLILSGLIWLLIQLSDEHTDHLQFKVQFSGISQETIMSSNLPKTIELEVKTYGFRLLEFRLNKTFNSIEIPLNPNSIKSAGKKGSYIRLSNYLTKIGESLGSDVVALSVWPDSIFISGIKQSGKKVPVVFNGDLKFEKQFDHFDVIILKPDSVSINGNDSAVKAVKEIKTQFIKLDKINSYTGAGTALELPAGIESVSPDYVKAEIPVYRFTEKKLIYPINIKGIPDSAEVRLFPSKISVTLNVAETAYWQIDENSISFYIEYADLLKSKTGRIKPKLKYKTDKARAVKLQPDHVDFMIIKKKKIKA